MKLATYVPVITLASTLQCFAFGGDVYNGPVQVGSSIPVSLDREITFRSLALAIDKCTLDAALQVAQQIYPLIPVENISYEPIVPTFGEAEYSFRALNGLKLPVLDNSLVGNNQGLFSYYQNTQDLTLSGNDSVNGYFILDPSGFTGTPTKTAIRAPWPQFAFDEVVRDRGVDAFGNPISPYRVAQNLKIVRPLLKDPEVVFENIASGRATLFTANTERYVNCLLTEIAQ